MTATTEARPRRGGALADGLAAASRPLLKLRHQPASIALTLAAPIVLVLVFGYVFGSAITVPGGADYREFLVPGLFVTIAFNFLPALAAVSADNRRGVIDRYRSMPISRAAVPAGQALATAVYGLLSFVLMALCGLAVGWRPHTGAGGVLAALGLLVAFQFAMTWVGMWLGLLVPSQEAAGQLGILALPLSMLSNVFVPTGGMPAWLRWVADHNPVSAASTAVRDLLGNPNGPANGAWPLEHPVTATLLWTAGLLVVFVPLTTLRFARPR